MRGGILFSRTLWKPENFPSSSPKLLQFLFKQAAKDTGLKYDGYSRKYLLKQLLQYPNFDPSADDNFALRMAIRYNLSRKWFQRILRDSRVDPNRVVRELIATHRMKTVLNHFLPDHRLDIYRAFQIYVEEEATWPRTYLSSSSQKVLRALLVQDTVDIEPEYEKYFSHYGNTSFADCIWLTKSKKVKPIRYALLRKRPILKKMFDRFERANVCRINLLDLETYKDFRMDICKNYHLKRRQLRVHDDFLRLEEVIRIQQKRFDGEEIMSITNHLQRLPNELVIYLKDELF